VAKDNGFIKLNRKIQNWEWYSDGVTMRVFLHLLLNASYVASRFQGHKIPVGSLVVGRKSLAKSLCLSEQQIRTALTKLKSTSEITIKSTNKFSICTIVKWADYQTQQPANQPAEQPTSNQQVTTLEEGKKVRIKDSSAKARFSPPTRQDVLDYAQSLEKPIDADRFCNHYEMAGWVLKNGRKMKDWKAAVRNWLKPAPWEKQDVTVSSLPDPLADKLACIAEAFDSGRHLFVGEKRVELANGLLVDIDSGRTVNAYQFLKSGSEVRIV